jgi:thiol-disulfide isomerase/thioredoxin
MINLVSRTLLIISTLLVIHSRAIAQKKYTRLHIGDRVPDVKFSSVRNYTFPKKSLSDFKGKFIIVDMWDKTCGACIAGMPHMEDLQKQFSDDLQVLLVTRSNKKDLSILLKNSKILQSVRLPMILGDTMITKHFFPYHWLPRHIWIDREGKVIAITQASEATDDNIARMIRGESPHLTIREDLDEKEVDELDDSPKPMMLASSAKYLPKLCYYDSYNDFKDSGTYYSLIMKRISGAHEGYMRYFQDKDENYHGVRFINFALYRLFQFAYNYYPACQSPITNVHYHCIPKIIVESDLSLLKEPAKANMSEHLRWEDEMSFCYDTRIANSDKDNWKFAEKLKLQMQKDLENSFGIKAIVEERQMKCFVLYRDSLQTAKFTAGQQATNLDESHGWKLFEDIQFFEMVLQWRQFMDPEDPPLINETGLFEQKVTLSLRTNLRNLNQLQEDFGKYGISVKEEIRNYQVLVLKKASSGEK